MSDEVRRIEERIAELEALEERMDDLEAIVQGDPKRRTKGLQDELEALRCEIKETLKALREDFETFKKVWDDRASFFRGIFWAISANGLLGIIAIVLQIVRG